jgi:hypothetical protein
MVIGEKGIEITVEVEKDGEDGRGRWEIERVRLDYVTLKQISHAIREIEKDES